MIHSAYLGPLMPFAGVSRKGRWRWCWRHPIASEHSDNEECPRPLLRGLKEGQVDRANCMALAGSIGPDLHSDSFHISRVHAIANCQAERDRNRYRGGIPCWILTNMHQEV